MIVQLNVIMKIARDGIAQMLKTSYRKIVSKNSKMFKYLTFYKNLDN